LLETDAKIYRPAQESVAKFIAMIVMS